MRLNNENITNRERRLSARTVVKGILSWVLWIASAVAVAFVINKAILVNAMVVSGSMEQTIMTGYRVLGNRLNYLFQEPQRLDIIVFLYPDDPDELPFVKRIIGLPGETVEIIAGTVYINDEPLDESMYMHEDMFGSYGPYVVPEGAFFVLGDNRNNSKDSRDWNEKYVPTNNILGKVYFRIFPSFGIIR